MTGELSRSFALQLVIVLAAIILVAVTWTFALVSIGREAGEAQQHAESTVAHLALAVEWQVQRQMQAIDGAMQGMAAEWRADPRRFDPAAWQRRSGLLAVLPLQVTLLDAAGMVIATTRQDLAGADKSGRAAFRAQLSPRAGLFIGPQPDERWQIDLSRRLERDDGSFAGAIVVTCDPWALTSMPAQVDPGPRGLIALVGGDGAIRALVSPYEVPRGQSISGTALFREAVRAGRPSWTGPSAPDGVVRVHALRRLPDQDLTIVAGVDEAVALQAARAWAADARTFATSVSVALLIMAWLLVREVQIARVRERRLAENQAILEAAYVELIEAKAVAEQQTAQLGTTLAGMSDGVMLLDAEFRLLQWNDRFPEYTGVPRQMLRVGLPMEDILRAQALSGEFGPVAVEPEVQRRMERLRAHAGLIVGERTRPNGRTVELRRAAVPDGGLVTLYIDVTARTQAEAAQAQARRLAEEASEQKSRFVAIVSHEIRTPLNAVVNSLGLLDGAGLTPAQHQLAETARQASEALLDLVRDILDLTRAEAGRMVLRPIEFEPRAMLQGVREMFATAAAARRIRLVVEVAPDVPQRLRADRGRLRQVVMNLVGNAAKFAPPGTLVAIRAATAAADARALLRLSVHDQGPRIPEREAARLFQPFSKLENAFAGGAAGTGLGLAICERLTRLMGGQIGLAASPGDGNEFWLSVALEEAAEPAEPGLAVPAPARRARVLLVEDLPPNQLIAATMLRRAGHLVDVAGSGAEALRLAERRPYDLVLMDLVMPGMGGLEAARRILALPPPAGSLPIVALTATAAPEDEARCRAVGMVAVLGKPVQPAELLAVVATVCRGAPLAPIAPVAAASVAATPVERPAVDAARLADLRRGLPLATLAPLVEQCLADIRQRLPVLQEALLAGRERGIEEGAHALAGMAGNFGLAALEARMRRIMAAMRARDLALAQVAAEGVDAELARSSAAIRLALAA